MREYTNMFEYAFNKINSVFSHTLMSRHETFLSAQYYRGELILKSLIWGGEMGKKKISCFNFPGSLIISFTCLWAQFNCILCKWMLLTWASCSSWGALLLRQKVEAATSCKGNRSIQNMNPHAPSDGRGRARQRDEFKSRVRQGEPLFTETSFYEVSFTTLKNFALLPLTNQLN